MIEQVLPNIYQIHVPLPGNPLKELNSYLIKGDGQNLLIDTGFRQEPCREALQSALEELGVRREETDVLVTHRHSDHCGLADLFVGEGRHIYVGSIDMNALQEWDRRKLHRDQDRRFLEGGFPAEVLTELESKNPARAMAIPTGVTCYAPLEDGDVLEIGGYKLKAILTPGHTPGHMCFWMEEQGAMFLGDHVLFNITPNITFWPDLPDALGAYLNSLRQIRTYDVALPLPAHRMRGDFHQRIDQLLDHHEQRLEEALRIVRERPGSTAYEITSHMTWSIRCSSWADFPVTQKWFAVGECLSHLDRLALLGEVQAQSDGGVLRYYAK